MSVGDRRILRIVAEGSKPSDWPERLTLCEQVITL